MTKERWTLYMLGASAVLSLAALVQCICNGRP